MPKQPTLTKAQINKLLNCQDMMKSSLQGLAVATKKLNQATANVEKENAGLALTSRGSAYYKKHHNSQKAKDAANKVDAIINKYEEHLVRIESNLQFLQSQLSYKDKMDDLINYYKNNIREDKSKIETVRSNKAIANRMSTYYQDKDDTAVWYRKYLRIGYWGVIIVLCLIVLYSLYKGQYMKNAYHATAAAISIAKDHIKSAKDKALKAKAAAQEAAKETAKKNAEKARRSVQVGGNKEDHDAAHRSLTRAQTTLPYSFSLLLLLLLTPYVVEPIISFLKPIFFPYA